LSARNLLASIPAFLPPPILGKKKKKKGEGRREGREGRMAYRYANSLIFGRLAPFLYLHCSSRKKKERKEEGGGGRGGKREGEIGRGEAQVLYP